MRTFTQRHAETHNSSRIGWLRAAVLGANDGIVSTGSLLIGVAAAGATHQTMMVTGIAGLVAGAMSMAAGEYVSVHAQADTEHADLAREKREIDTAPEAEHRELADIYVKRGIAPELARQVAVQLMAHDALGSHARDELGISEALSARPFSAASASAMSFIVGAILPVAVSVLVPLAQVILWVSLMSLIFLAVLGAIAAKAGGASVLLGAWRVTFWGALAMVITALVGRLFGAVV
ncbi:VIT family protein [Pseudomonas sp. KU26590]|uniref:VIT1/CCC1 transporter family protein n=1 Tax=Pseudomonas sp. KU26590 TaxID=2991051 RepID=UPI00223D204D|nr:VIT family protein [Pseudomonas sp. KU26590]UZJ57961.1 VIT family protein [Pseudomonas sp. KU26590]